MQFLKNTKLEEILFIDCETVTISEELNENTGLYNAWHYKNKNLLPNFTTNAEFNAHIKSLYKNEGALYPEFSKICCISIGLIKNNRLHLKSFSNEDERTILIDFLETLNKLKSTNKNLILSGFAIKGFDIPFLTKRLIVNNLEIPIILDFIGLKPWEIKVLDLLEIWRGTSFSTATLISITNALGLESPKTDLIGYKVGDCFYSSDKNKFSKIEDYCEKDVIACCQILLKMLNINNINTEQIQQKELNTEQQAPLLTHLFNGGNYGLKEAKLLTNAYVKATEQEKEALVTILKSIITKETGFTQKHLEAIVNYKPKVK